MAQDLKDTLQLPQTDFPMRAGLPQREPARLAHWEKRGLYAAIQKRRSAPGTPVFVLHDGPPFTNGDVHIGTALNKTLKEVILRYKSMRGFRTPYVPGWDCHGLPIEQKVARDLFAKLEAEAGPPVAGKPTAADRDSSLSHLPILRLRNECDGFSEAWIAKQTVQFKRLGILADWKNEYKTKAPIFEAEIVRTFAAFVERGLVYRSKKPVYWSIPFETALAEAEIEYKDHTSIAIWVKFAVSPAAAEKFGLPTDKPLFIVIWTTTPWTIPANLALALNPAVEYGVIATESEYLFVAAPLAAAVAAAAKLGAVTFRAVGPGRQFENLVARHPFIDRDSRVVLADYVTTDTGTGAVHTAPGHGIDDYQTGLKYGLEIYCPVGDDGRYLADGKVPPDLVGLTTLESVEDLAAKKTSAANVGVLKKLAAAGALLAKQKYEHSYPHCWRSKTPIIFRAVDQWFVSLDQESPPIHDAEGKLTAPDQTAVAAPATPRNEALAAIDRIAAANGWIPPWGEARIRNAVASRPDWCVSRQRAWGVPLPAFFDSRKKAYLDQGVARAIAAKIELAGSNIWFEATAEQLLQGVELPADWPSPRELVPGRDTLDVWFDSGSSHAAVLQKAVGGTSWPADLYLEGSDQHRGWFQSSLWTGIVRYRGAPYKAVLTHGFIVDQERNKISKSSVYEKPQTSDAYIAEYGADVIRLWIASQDFRDDIPISKEILSHVSETYRLLRNTLRFQLANLFDFEAARDSIPIEELDPLDRWALHLAAALIRDCAAAYDAYEFHRVYQLCNQFCSVTLSAVYHDILKDRLYTLGRRSRLRRSSQTAMDLIFRALVRLLAPLIPFTADEAWTFATAGAEYADDSVHLQDWPAAPTSWSNAAIEAEFAALLRIRSRVNEAIEPLRAAGKLGKALDAAVALTLSQGDPVRKVVDKHRDFLAELFIVSAVEVIENTQPEPLTSGSPALATSADLITIAVEPAQDLGNVRCPRCWRWVPVLGPTDLGDLCPRCQDALKT